MPAGSRLGHDRHRRGKGPARVAATLRGSELYLTYGNGYIFDGLSIEVVSGAEPAGLIGASGVGKTSLLNALAGNLKPPRGLVSLDGRSITRLMLKSKAEFKARVRLVSQYSMTVSDPRATAANRVIKALRQARRGGRSHATPTEELLGSVGLTESHAHRPLSTLSGGERQRVALAVALATRPEILLLDEPLTGLDPTARGELTAHLKQIIGQLGIGVLIASHDLDLVRRLCPSVYAMAEGRIVASGPLDQVLKGGSHPAIAELGEAAPVAAQRFR